MYWPVQFLKSQFFASIPYPTSDFTGQTVIITGANTGLGKEAARHVVRLGASKVILAVRTISKGQAAADEITKSCEVPVSTVEVWALDLSDYDSVKAFSRRAQGLDRLDAVLQNAGIMPSTYSEVQGQESMIAVNVIAPALLGTLLLPKLQSSARKTGLRGRLAFVGSDLQYVAAFKEADTTGALMDALRDPKSANMADR